jgi:hypothetical protein
MKQLDLKKQKDKDRAWTQRISRFKRLSLTDVPAKIGTWISKTIIRAVKADASAMGFVGGHSTLPTSRWMGSIAVRYKVTFDPAAAHCTLSASVSVSMAAIRTIISKSRRWV